MIIDCISDLHGEVPKLEGGDLLIVAGDLTATDQHHQYVEFIEWLSVQNYRKKIVVAGNHDNLLQQMVGVSKFIYSGTYLCDSGTEFEGLKIWGSPYTEKFRYQNPSYMAFSLDSDDDLKEHFDLIPDDTDILVTHSPPAGILDRCLSRRAGSEALRQTMFRVKPKLMVFGHIHQCGGQQVDFMTTKCVNAAYMNECYDPVNKPVRIESGGLISWDDFYGGLIS